MGIHYHAAKPDLFAVLAVDLGALHDPTAFSLVCRIESPMEPKPGQNPDECWELRGSESHQKTTVRYEVRRLKRIPLMTSYDEIMAMGVAMYGRVMEYANGNAELVLDIGGVGRPEFDRWQAAGLDPIGVTFTAGREVNRIRHHEYTVPKPLIVQEMLTRFGSGELKIAKGGQPEEEILRKELTGIRPKLLANRSITYEHQRGEHDDLLFSVGIGLWRASNRPQHVREVKIIGLY